MAVLFRWLLRLMTVALVLGVLGTGLVYYLAMRSLPDYDKTLSVAGLTAPVEIVRDTAAVPHIFGDSDPDVFFGLGYAHAQDRLWQMVIQRRTVQGRLSELFGNRTVATDTLMRRLDLYGLAVSSVLRQDPAAQAALEAYAAGVNARIAEINADSLGRGAPEFFLYEASIAPWRPADSLALIKLWALSQSAHLQQEVLRAQTSLALEDPARLADLLPDLPGQSSQPLPPYATLVPGPLPKATPPRPRPDFLNPMPAARDAATSNAFAAAGARSAGGGTLLANDLHVDFTAPTLWYMARLELAGGGVIGATLPGVPAVLAGRSEQIAWGLSASALDDQDLFLEEINPDNTEQYRTPDGWARFDTRQSIIGIKGAPPVTLTLRWTENGPVLPRALLDLASVTPPGHVVTLGWTALSEADTTYSGAFALMQAGSVAEALEAGTQVIAPAQVLTVIDAEHVAQRTLGARPARDPLHESQGRLPVLGWHAQNRWQGELPSAEAPQDRDPEDGIVSHTNGPIAPEAFPRHGSFDWADSQRGQRLTGLMEGREVHTRDSFIEAQLDTVSQAARTLLPLIGRELWFTGEAAQAGTPERQRQRALALLADWNGEMNEHLPEPLLYSAWVQALQQRLIRDELGPLARAFTRVEPLFIERVFRDIDGAGVWCDVTHSVIVETCTDIARAALDDALVGLQDRFGPDLESLRWGEAHQATHDHPALGDVRVLRYFVNLRQSTSGGDHTLMMGRADAGDSGFGNAHGAGYRGVYDFADPDSSVYITATGQSGHLLSRHYDDLGQLWRRGEYIPMSLDEGLARAASDGVTQLLPK